MTTDQLRLFLSIARHRSMARAAAEFELGQATVSERLKALETEVGTALFERRGRGVTLTPAGAAFLPHAERALDVLRQAHESARAASEGRGGLVSVAVTVTSGAYLFAPALAAFQRDHPNVEVRVRSVHSWDAPGLILDGIVELALVSGPATPPQIEQIAAFRAPLVLVAGNAHPRAQHRFTLKQLAQEQILVSYWGPASQTFLERIRAAGEGATGMWLELSPVELVKGMLRSGKGVSLVPEIAVRRELAAGDLSRVRLADSGVRLPSWEITLIRAGHRHGAANPAAATLAAVLTEKLPGLLKD